MPRLFDVRRRRREPEIMDQPDLDRVRHLQALRGLERINFWSRSATTVWGPLAALARQRRPEPVRVLDLATGAGDLPIRLWRLARRAGLNVRIDGCDLSPDAVTYEVYLRN